MTLPFRQCLNSIPLGQEGRGPKLMSEAEIVKDAGAVGRHLDAGANLAERRGLFEHGDFVAPVWRG